MASGQRVGFLGLGLMGRGMAKNLATKGFQVTVWNRSRRGRRRSNPWE
jgi:3-hydroxyisobutyrate dehydrogenase